MGLEQEKGLGELPSTEWGLGFRLTNLSKFVRKAPILERTMGLVGMRLLCTSLVSTHVLGDAYAGEQKGLRGGAPPSSEGYRGSGQVTCVSKSVVVPVQARLCEGVCVCVFVYKCWGVRERVGYQRACRGPWWLGMQQGV